MGWVSWDIGKQVGQPVGQAKTPVGTGQQENAAVRTDRPAIRGRGNFFLVDTWQGEWQERIVVGGEYGRFRPA
jgi:hypothetical protein